MTLLDAKPPDLARERRVRNTVIAAICVLVMSTLLAFWFRYWTQEHLVDQFFIAIEKKNFDTAFALWNADPDWKQHVEKYNKYTFGQFELDWGPSGEYGPITKHEVAGSARPRSKGNVSGIVVKVIVNGRAEPACLWVEDAPHTIGFSPIPCS